MIESIEQENVRKFWSSEADGTAKRIVPVVNMDPAVKYNYGHRAHQREKQALRHGRDPKILTPLRNLLPL